MKACSFVTACLLVMGGTRAKTEHVASTGDWLTDWAGIACERPVAWSEIREQGSQKSKVLFYDLHGKVIGQLSPPTFCAGIGVSTDWHFADFICTVGTDSPAQLIYVADIDGRSAHGITGVSGAKVVWTTDDSLVVYTGGLTTGDVPERIVDTDGGLSVPVCRSSISIDSLSRVPNSGQHAFAGFHVPIFLGVVSPDRSTSTGAFWLDNSLSKSSAFLSGKDVQGLSISHNGKYIGVYIAGEQPSLLIIRSSDSMIVWQEHLKDPCSSLQWSQTGQVLAATVVAGHHSSASILIYDVDKSRLRQYSAPFTQAYTAFWNGSTRLILFGEGPGLHSETIAALDANTGLWSKWADLPLDAEFHALE